MSQIKTHKTINNIKIKNTKIKIYDCFKYAILDLYIIEKHHEKIAITHVKTKFYLINDFKTKMFINMNILKSKKVIFNFDNKIIIVSTCENMKISISFYRKKKSINCM